jgi:hypothetical protein
MLGCSLGFGGMSLFSVLAVWLGATFGLLIIPMLIGWVKVRLAELRAVSSSPLPRHPRIEILIPVKGSLTNHIVALTSVLTQTYPDYGVMFIVESEEDSANESVNELCDQYAHARKTVSGVAAACAQKNYNLIAGVHSLGRDTEIIVFCDATNVMEDDWLERIVRPIVTDEVSVVTTFRSFKPEPETPWGCSQAVYGSFVLLLGQLNPTPWGGATVIKRSVFDSLNVLEEWSRTVVDDLVLGNLLRSAGVTVRSAPQHRLTSPLRHHSMADFLSHVDRQILFPKFTNPSWYYITLPVHLNQTISIAAAAVTGGVLFPAGLVSGGSAAICGIYLAGLLAVALMLRTVSPFSISLRCWLTGFMGCMFGAAYIYLRSVFRDYIIWHGRKYRAGRGGVVREVEFLESSP